MYLLWLFYIVGVVATMLASMYLQGRENYNTQKLMEGKPFFFGIFLSPLWPVLWASVLIALGMKYTYSKGNKKAFGLNTELTELRRERKVLEMEQDRILRHILDAKLDPTDKDGIRALTMRTIETAMTTPSEWGL